MLISRGTVPEQPVEWAHSAKMAKRIITNFKTESHEFSNYAVQYRAIAGIGETLLGNRRG